MEIHFGQEGPNPTTPVPPPWKKRVVRVACALALLGLFAFHVWLTLLPVGGFAAWRDQDSGKPILTGRHPLHLYHAILGSEGLVHRGQSTGIDPFFHVGYPKTPVFDSGSRFPERILALVMVLRPGLNWWGEPGSGPVEDPFEPWSKSARTYLRGWLLALCLVPALLFGISWALRRDLSLALAFTCLGLAVWWSPPSQDALAQGHAEWLFGGLLLAWCHAFFVRFHQGPSLLSWLFLTLGGVLALLVQPAFMILGAPFFLGYYMRVGPKHEWVWHVGLWSAAIVPFLFNADWLGDWVRYWWIRQPASLEWRGDSAHWLEPWKELIRISDPASGPLFLLLGFLFLVGWAVLHFLGSRALGRTFAFVVGGFLGLAGLGFVWEPAQRLEVEALFFTAIWFSLYPAAFGINAGVRFPWAVKKMAQGLESGPCPKGVVGILGKGLGFVGVLGILGWLVHAGPRVVALAQSHFSAQPLHRTLSAEQADLLELIRAKTQPSARILWEDGPPEEEKDRWTALLPLWTGRTYIGGLDAWAGIEHLGSGLVDGRLAGTSISTLENRDLAQYFDTFNVGWVVAQNPKTRARLESYGRARLVAQVGQRGLYALERTHSFILRGKAELVEQTPEAIVLANLEPADGQLVLSLHYHSQWEVVPSRIAIERELDPRDPIPLVRLKLDEPVSRLVLRYRRQ